MMKLAEHTPGDPFVPKRLADICACDQIYIFGYISRPHMGTFKLHISCTQAMCSLQYRLHMEHFSIHKGGPLAAPPCISFACSICSLFCRLHTHALCAAYVQLQCAHMCPRYVAIYINVVTRILNPLLPTPNRPNPPTPQHPQRPMNTSSYAML